MSRFIGIVSAYAYAVSQGYTGTEEEYAELMASYATVAEEAAESAESASASATSASASASTASTKASEASASATTASSKASEASASATSAQTAQGLAESARDDAIDAKTDAENARDLAQQYAESIDPDNIFSAYATDTASGAVATFTDGADDIPMKSVKVAIEPVQDLHGQDAPYPAGGGKNLVNFPDIPSTTRNGVTYRVENGRLYIHGTCTDGISINADTINLASDTYTISAQLISGSISGSNNSINAWSSNYTRYLASFGTSGTSSNLTFTDDVARVSVFINVNAVFNNAVIGLQIEKGDSMTSFTPYSNICPISGWTGAQMVRCGKNLFDKTKVVEGVYIMDGNGNEHSGNAIATDYIPVKGGETYYVLSEQTLGSWGAWYDRDKNYISGITGYTPVSIRTKTAPDNACYMRLTIKYNGSGNPDTFSVNYPSTDHDYHPFTGNDTYPITFPSEAGTVYGGELDVTNGTLTVDRAMVDLGTLNWNFDSGVFYTSSAPLFGTNGLALVNNTIIFAENKCEIYKSDVVTLSNPVNGRFFVTNSQATPILRVSDNRFSDAASFKTAMDGVMAIFKLKESVVYHLTPTEINSLLGDNNVWADAGDTTVTYRADPNLYIDKRIGTEAPMIATDNIVSGSYFMVGNNLYKATANIASGAAVVVGTNATAKTMAEALNEINA